MAHHVGREGARRPGIPVTCFVCKPWNAVITGLKNSSLGSAVATASSTSSLTRCTTSSLSNPSLGDDDTVALDRLEDVVELGVRGKRVREALMHEA